MFRKIDCPVHGNDCSTVLNGNCAECVKAEKELTLIHKTHTVKQSILKEFIATIPSRYSDSTFDNFCFEEAPEWKSKQENIIESLKKINFSKNIVFTGTTGTAKTHLACATIKNVIKNLTFTTEQIEDNEHNLFEQLIKGNRCVYINFYELCDMKIDDHKTFQDILKAKYLIIDELHGFGTKDSAFKNELLFRILNYRYGNCLNSFLISNYGADYFIANLGDASYSRLKENCLLCEALWPDYRLKKQKNNATSIA